MKKIKIKSYDDQAEQYLEQNYEFRTNLIKLINNLDRLVQMEFATWINNEQIQSFRLNGYFRDPDVKIITVFSSDQNQLFNQQMWLKLCQFKSNELDCYYEADTQQLTFVSNWRQSLVWNFNKGIENYDNHQIEQLQQVLLKIAQSHQSADSFDFVFSFDDQNQIQTSVVNKSQATNESSIGWVCGVERFG